MESSRSRSAEFKGTLVEVTLTRTRLQIVFRRYALIRGRRGLPNPSARSIICAVASAIHQHWQTSVTRRDRSATKTNHLATASRCDPCYWFAWRRRTESPSWPRRARAGCNNETDAGRARNESRNFFLGDRDANSLHSRAERLSFRLLEPGLAIGGDVVSMVRAAALAFFAPMLSCAIAPVGRPPAHI